MYLEWTFRKFMMNFNYQRKMPMGPPLIRQFVTIVAPQHDTKFMNPDFLSKLPNEIRHFGTNIISNKSFSNPNFVNKTFPNILTSSVAGTIPFSNKVPVQNYQELRNHDYHLQQPRHCERKEINKTEPEKISSQNNNKEIEITEMPIQFSKSEEIVPKVSRIESPKTGKKVRKNRKRRRGGKRKEVVDEVKQKTMTKKNNSPTVSPNKLKKNGEMKTHSKKNKKCKPWHKISLAMEIEESNEPPNFQPETPREEVSVDEPDFVSIKSHPIEIPICITISPCQQLLNSFSSSEGSTLSSSSPCISRIRIPSECESEDSFIVFCEDSPSCDISSDDDSASEVDSEEDCFLDEDFTQKTDLNKDTVKKKVSFKNDAELCEIHPMVKWGFAYHNARRGPWEQIARDRARFESRIANLKSILSPILYPEHRDRIYKERFENRQQ